MYSNTEKESCIQDSFSVLVALKYIFWFIQLKLLASAKIGKMIFPYILNNSFPYLLIANNRLYRYNKIIF